ncbi:hypothetical protein OEZ86_010485 [Tetradesmus obliquus]|nr:hypothetical protein OEZ86_010485 [Tetradesmus obliquus]
MNRPAKHSKELAGAIAEDSRRQAIDDAKKRAVSQHADYDTFKKLVSVAHLKPLHAPSAGSQGNLLPAWKMNTTAAAAGAGRFELSARLISSKAKQAAGQLYSFRTTVDTLAAALHDCRGWPL